MTPTISACTACLGPLWANGLYRALLVMAAAEFLLILVQMGWLAGRLLRARTAEREAGRFAEACGPTFLAAVDDPDRRASWLSEASRWKPDVVASFIHGYLLRTEGSYRDALASLYREAGLHLHDIRLLGSRRWPQRVLAMRRLSEVARPEDGIVLRVRPRDPYVARIAALVLLARVGNAEGVKGLLSTFRVSRRLMEQPLHSTLLSLPRTVLAATLDAWDRLPDPVVRRVLLAVAAERVPNACCRWLTTAARDPDPEIRVGACIAAGRLATPESFGILLNLLGDPAWFVRARAAQALGAHGEPSAVDALGYALGDPVAWVRQNAATSLRLLGEEGMGRLRGVADVSYFPLARRMAKMEIGNEEMHAEREGETP
ncbi:MAG: HEAT repeat domain-containing protein [Deltaproteobacteria bacterium]|nr:HEAT repeat domain-containing protein [Deltaproteobacteria bacterium]